MAVYEVFVHPELRKYKTNVCSRATYIQIFIVALTFIPPLLIAYRSQGFWIKTDSFREQPDVHFKHQLLLILETLEDGSYVAWSTYQNFNLMQQNHLRIPVVKSREEDSNRDGKYDALHLNIEVPLLDSEKVHSVKLLLFFDYRLSKFPTFVMESMGYIHYDSPRPGAELHVVGSLKLQQKDLFGHRGLDVRYNESIINSTTLFADAFQLSKIFTTYATRNVTTVFESEYPVWITGRGAGQPFVITATVNYPEETVYYIPGFWQLIKWAWVQYLAILLIFLFVFDRIKTFIFQNQLVPTIVERPFKVHGR